MIGGHEQTREMEAFQLIDVSDLEPGCFANIMTHSRAQRSLKEKFMEVSMKAQLGMLKNFYVPIYEPSCVDGRLHFVKDETPYLASELCNWKRMAENFCPGQSRLATTDEYFLILARLLKDGKFNYARTIGEMQLIADDSSMMGNYYSTYQSSRKLEMTGYRHVGTGLYGFVGNTFKLLSDPDNFYYGGGCFMTYGDEYPLANVVPATKVPAGIRSYAVGLVILEQK